MSTTHNIKNMAFMLPTINSDTCDCYQTLAQETRKRGGGGGGGQKEKKKKGSVANWKSHFTLPSLTNNGRVYDILDMSCPVAPPLPAHAKNEVDGQALNRTQIPK